MTDQELITTSRFWRAAAILICLVVVGGGLALRWIQSGRERGEEVGVSTAKKTPPGEAQADKAGDASPDQAAKKPDPPDAPEPNAPAASEERAEPAAEPQATDAAAGAQPAAPPPKTEDHPAPTPWDSLLRASDPPAAFREVCFAGFDTGRTIPQRDDLPDWFAAIPGQQHAFRDAQTNLGRCGMMEGIVGLRAPLTEETAFRFWPVNFHGLQIHCFRGQRGVTLVYHESQRNRWSAYATSRQPEGVRPQTWALTQTDDDRCRRTEIRFGGPLALRSRAGRIVLSRGDICLISVDLGGLPDEVYWEGKSAFHGLALVRSAGCPLRAEPEGDVPARERPAQWEWRESLPEQAALQRLENGAVCLRAEKASQRGWVAWPLPRNELGRIGLAEIIVELQDATPGTGLFLGRGQDGAPAEVLRVLKHQPDGRALIAMRGNDDAYDHGEVKVIDNTVSFAAEGKQWVKLLFGCGVLRWWISADGKSWAEPTPPLNNLAGDITHLGLHHVGGRAGCRITLNGVRFRPLAAMQSLAQDKLAAAPPLHQQANAQQWSVSVLESLPHNTNLDQWRRAVAIRSLAAGCGRQLGHELVQMLLTEAMSSRLSLPQHRELLDEAALLLDLRSDAPLVEALVSRYHQLAHDTARPFSAVRGALMTTPIATDHFYLITSQESIRSELIHLIYNRQWREARDFCQLLRFFHQHQGLPLFEWAESVAIRNLPVARETEQATQQLGRWRNPFIEEINKPTYNLLAELQAVLESDSFADAAQMIISASPDGVSGVAPYGGDSELLLSLPTAFRQALREFPALRDEINQKYGERARFRIRDAIAAGNERAVEVALSQFEETPAAEEAHRWLGDRALSSGWFRRALAEYERAAPRATQEEAPQLSARRRLASAMLGIDWGQPATQVVQFGDVTMSPDEFEKLVAEMIQAKAQQSQLESVQAVALSPPPAPSGWKLQRRARLDGDAGNNPNHEVVPHVNRLGIDWVGRQIAAARQGDRLYVSNRFQVACYRLDNGQLQWRAQRPPGNMLRSRDWSHNDMAPLLGEKSIFCRQLYGHGPKLACFDKENGQLRWTSEPERNELVISDPMFLQGRLVALTLRSISYDENQVRLTRYDPQTGEAVEHQTLLRLRDDWKSRLFCRATPLHDAVVGVISGVVFCCDAQGQLKWIRRQELIPPDRDADWVWQEFQRPIFYEDKLLVHQPGVPVLYCLHAETGTVNWRLVMPHLQRILGVSDQQVIVQTDGHLSAIGLADGKTRWRTAVGRLLESQLCGARYAVICHAQPLDNDPQRRRPRLEWLDLNDGRSVASFSLEDYEDADPRMGPMLSMGGRLWTFWGRGANDPHRDLVELIPEGSAEPARVLPSPAWTQSLEVQLQTEFAADFSPWTLVAAASGDRTGKQQEAHGEREVFGLRVRGDAPLALVRRLEFPGNGRPKMRIRVGEDANLRWSLQVRFDQEVVWEREFDANSLPSRWRDLEIDLSGLAGKSGYLSLIGRYQSGEDSARIYLKRLAIEL